MTDIPIIFSAPMVRAWLAGNKTMTRRLLYSERKAKGGIIPASATMLEGHPQPPVDFSKPMGAYWTLSGWQKVKPGDRLWVRENFYTEGGHDGNGFGYAADIDPAHAPPRLTPCIHMPRRLSRLTLIVGAVKIERLQKISNADAFAEGIERREPFPVESFKMLWDSLHGSGAWDANPEVIAITASKVIKANIDAAEARAA